MTESKQHHSVSIVGAGKVGTTLAVLLHKAGYRVVSVISRRQSSAKKLASIVQCTYYSNSLSNISPSTRILIIATPEESISEIAKQLAAHQTLDFRGLVAFHTSGVLTSDILRPLQQRGVKVFSLHPIQTFPKRIDLKSQLQRMEKVCYGFEGSLEVLRMAKSLVKAFGGVIIRIPKEKKILYHIGCVVASNYSVALLGMVEELLGLVDGNIRLRHLSPLIKTSVENAIRLTPKKALTGPIARGSIVTIKSHLHELLKTDKRLAVLYRQYGKQVLYLASVEGRLAQKTLQKLSKILYNAKSENKT